MEFLELVGEWRVGTKNHMHRICVLLSSHLRSSSATAIPVWGVPFPDSCEPQDPTVMPLCPGA